jgi:hypothetical protein
MRRTREVMILVYRIYYSNGAHDEPQQRHCVTDYVSPESVFPPRDDKSAMRLRLLLDGSQVRPLFLAS